MICKNCGKYYDKKYFKTEFCSVKCSNLYKGKQKNPIYLLVKDYNNFKDIPPEILKKLYAIDTYNVSCALKTYGLHDILAEYRKFKNENKLCLNCGDFYPVIFNKSQDICPKESCKEYYGAKKKDTVEKNAKTKLRKYGDSKYNNREKFKETYKAKPPEEIELWNKHRSEALQKSREEWYEITQQRKATHREKTGYESPFQIPENREKSIAAVKSPVIKEKRRQTYLKNHGVACGFQAPEIKEKIRQTNLEKRGVEYISQDPEIKEKIRQTNLEKRGVEYVSQDPEIQKKMKETNLEKRGVKYFSQAHISNYKDYETSEVWENFKSVQEACNYFNISISCAIHNLRKYNPKAIKNRSITQNLIFEALKVDSKIANTKNIIPPRELDIYLPDYKLAIEYDGLLFHSQGVSKHSMLNTPDFDKNYHLQKTLECNSQGIQLFHIFEGENIDLWLSMINNKLGLNSRIYARNCYAEELRNSDVREFLNENHLQGFCNASIALGLYLQDFKNTSKEGNLNTSKLVAVMTFSKPRFSKGYEYELVRFCSLKGFNIVGGASKLWKFFLKKYNPKSVISYANLRFSNGKLYENLGFSLSHRSSPNYYYFKDDMILHSRNKFQKHKLSNLLENYNSSKSEVENMFANGYRRIFDCGNLVYEWFADLHYSVDLQYLRIHINNHKKALYGISKLSRKF